MTPHNRSLVEALIKLMNRFATDKTTISDVQAQLQSTIVLFDLLAVGVRGSNPNDASFS
jgi:hypothetical protein